MRLQMNNSINSGLREIEDHFVSEGVGRSSVPTLSSIKSEFNQKKDEDARRMIRVLKESYPDLKPSEIIELVKKFHNE